MDHTRVEFCQLCRWLPWPVRWEWVCALNSEPPYEGPDREKLERSFAFYDAMLAMLPADFNECPNWYPAFLTELQRGLVFIAQHGGKRHSPQFWQHQLERFTELWCDIECDSCSDDEEHECSIELAAAARAELDQIDANRQSPPQAPPSHPKSTSDEFFSFLERK